MPKRIEFLKDRGFTSVSLAQDLGVAQPQISMWMSGSKWPNKRNFFRLVNAIGVEPKELGHYLLDRWVEKNK